ncbi:hypothetical protein K438DRAFT_2018444 [Mycena galopus ATCC 62051]|nr:hypothetical protein K438DRAFT_2018444 [Mycena galopus ATCC 62051]
MPIYGTQTIATIIPGLLHPALSARNLSQRDALILKLYSRGLKLDAEGIVVESIFCSAYGIFFAVALFQVIAFIPSVDGASRWEYLREIIPPTGNQIAGMYPTIIIIISFNRTRWEEFPTAPSNDVARSGRIQTVGSQHRVDNPAEFVIDIAPENLEAEEKDKQFLFEGV